MSGGLEIRNVVLRGDDLNFPAVPWRRVRRANNFRLIPLAAALMLSGLAFGSLLNPSILEILAVFGPILIGWLLFVWQANVHYVGEYKKAYAATPSGRIPCTFVFDDRGMKQSAASFETDFRWDTFAEVSDEPSGFRFWLTPFMAVFIPTRFIEPEQEGELRRLILRARERGDIKGIPD
jgi:hypothetical protein